MKRFQLLCCTLALFFGAALLVNAQVFYTLKVCADSAFTQCHTVPAVTSDTITLNNASQTLASKSLTTPSITSGASLGGVLTATTDAIGAAITNQVLVRNTTAATSGAQVQNSPTLKFSGTGWTGAASQTVSGEIYVNPFAAATVVPIFTFDVINGTGTRTTVMGITPSNVSFAGSLGATAGTVTAAAGGAFILNGRSRLQSGADGRFTFMDNAAAKGLEVTFGADPTVT